MASQLVIASLTPEAFLETDYPWDSFFVCACLAMFVLPRPTEGLDSSRWWNGHANCFLPASPTRHLRDWTCQGVAGRHPYLLISDQSCAITFFWYIQSGPVLNQHEIALSAWSPCQTQNLEGHSPSPPAPLRFHSRCPPALHTNGSAAGGPTHLPRSPLWTGHLLGQLCWTGLGRGSGCHRARLPPVLA